MNPPPMPRPTRETYDDLAQLDTVWRQLYEDYHDADLSPAMAAAGDLLRAKHRETYPNQLTPEGTRFRRNSEEWIRHKKHDIVLLYTGRLEHAVLEKNNQDHVEVIGDDGRMLTFGVAPTVVSKDGFFYPGVWQAEERGGISGARYFLGMTDKTVDEINERVADEQVVAIIHR